MPMPDGYRPIPGQYDAEEEEKNAKAAATSGATSKAKLQNAGGLGSLVKAVRPLRKSDESASDYADRVAKWQKTQDDAQFAGQKKALKSLP